MGKAEGQNTKGRGRLFGSRTALANQLSWTQPSYVDSPLTPLSSDQIEAIHEASLDILDSIGIMFVNNEALDILTSAGCDVNRSTKIVKMDRQWVSETIKTAPSQFTLTPRNSEHSLKIGGHYFSFGQVSSPPNVMDNNKGRRNGTREDFQDLLRLSQSYNCIHFIGGYPVEPLDLHPSVRHLYCTYDKLCLTDKVLHGYSLGKERIEDVMEMVRIASGLSHDAFDSSPHMFTNINSTSPLKHDYPMLDGAIRLARRGQPVVVTPFTLSGAVAPVTIVGAITQQNAEALAAIALLQAVNPGAPVVYGAFTINVDMKSGAPAFGTPEYVRSMQISGQMARYYNLPLRTSNANAANAPDAQAIWESSFSLQACQQGWSNMIYHAAGWLEGGLTASFEKFVIDCELLQQIIYTQQSIKIDDEELALEAVREVGHDGHFFGCSHTQARYKSAYYSPLLSDWSNFESWEEAGAVWTHDGANHQFKQILREYEPPHLNPAINEELQEFVAKRIEEGGAPTDY